MFGIGPTELFVVAVLALVLFSPRELPGMLRSAMKFWGSIKRTADEFKDAIMQEESFQDLRDAYDGTKSSLRKAESDARRELMKARTEMRKAQGKLAKVATVAKTRAEAESVDAAVPAAAAEATGAEATRATTSEPSEAVASAPATAASSDAVATEGAPEPTPGSQTSDNAGGDSAANQGAA